MQIQFEYQNNIITINGYHGDHITNVIYRSKNFYEQHILEYIKSRFVGGTALDIGANIGNHSIYFSKFIFDKTFAFEANKNNFLKLNQNKQDNNVNNKLYIYNTALSDGHYNFTSCDIRVNMGANKVVEGRGDSITTKIDDYQLPKIDFIKMDVEGYELKVLRGGYDLITRDFPEIILECNSGTDSDLQKVAPYMENLGYEQINNFSTLYHFKKR